MISTAKKAINELKITDDIYLVSGGAVWSDHVAVRLFLDDFSKGLELYLPCKRKNKKFYEKPNCFDWKQNPGYLANIYHDQFNEQVKGESFSDIEKAIRKGARIIEMNGFHVRNSKIAQVDYLFAFSFDENVSGGTQNTWIKCKCDKHVLPIIKQDYVLHQE